MTDPAPPARHTERARYLHLETTTIGRAWADEISSIWDPVDQIAPRLRAFANERAFSMAPRPRWRDMESFAWTWVLFGTGFVIFLIGGAFKDEDWPSFLWMVNTLAWIAAWLWTLHGTDRLRKEHLVRLEALSRAIFDAASVRIEERKREAREYRPDTPSSPANGFVPAGPAPRPQPYGVSHEGAEHLVAEWMAYLGAKEVQVTRFSGDGGIDVSGLHYIAQVKNYAGTVDVASVRELAGVAYADGRKPLFFTSGAYASGAVAFAEQVGIALFVYDAINGTLSPVGEKAIEAMRYGL